MTRLALLVPGAGGQLSTDVVQLAARWPDVVGCRGLTIEQLDVTDRAAVDRTLDTWARAVRRDADRLVVLNAAAYTAVDRAETDEALAFAVNATGPALLASACARLGAQLVHVSTDYVFPGDRVDGPPYEVDDPTGPVSAYGRTKLAGEQAVRELLPDASWVVRTAWVYGATGHNFVKTMARLEAERDEVTVVDDQCGSPTWSADLARALYALVRQDAAPGLYHCTGGGQTTWAGFARAVFEELGADPARVRGIATADYPTPAARPAYSVLSSRAWQQAGLPVMPDWRDALRQAFAQAGAAYRP